MPAPPRPELEEIYRSELFRVARVFVDMRASRVWFLLVPFGLLVALRPTPARAGLSAVAVALAVLLSRLERRRLAQHGVGPSFLLLNVLFFAIVHSAGFLLTGSLASPVLPLLLAFTFSGALLIGPAPLLWVFVAFEGSIVCVLAVAHLTGWAALLAPAAGWGELTTTHALVIAGCLLLLLVGAARIARGLRGFFDQVVERAAERRQDLLDAHRAQAEELSALSGAIAHELKNPLATVKGLAGLLARDVPEGKSAERLGVLRREVDRMQGVLDDFLNFSRPAVPLSVEEVDLQALAADVVALHEGVARERGARVTVTGAARARADARKTSQILVNLVQNALEASPPGGVVAVALGAVGPEATVTVADDGAGLAPEVRERLFQAGVTSKPRGNGLGLTIARGLARQQGGELTLADGPAGGCRATLTLPAGGPS